MHTRLKPKGALWMGIGLILVSYASQWLQLLIAPDQQQGELVDAVMRTVGFFYGVALPLGIAFVVFAMLGRVLVGARRGGDGDAADDSQIRRVFSPRRVLLAGVVLIAIGFVLETSLINWTPALSGESGIARDFVLYLVPLLRTVILPLGILLIPAGWLLHVLATGSVSKLANSRVD